MHRRKGVRRTSILQKLVSRTCVGIHRIIHDPLGLGSASSQCPRIYLLDQPVYPTSFGASVPSSLPGRDRTGVDVLSDAVQVWVQSLVVHRFPPCKPNLS